MTNVPWELYRRILQSVPIACVDVAIVHDGRVLLVERLDEPARGHMWLPGGRVFKGEMMREAAARKAKEEVGIECHVGPMVHTAETIFQDGPEGIAVHSINSCFLLFPTTAEVVVVLDDHSAKYAWVDKIDDNLHEYVRHCLKGTGLSF